MLEIMADPPVPSCNLLFFGFGIEEIQTLAPDLFWELSG
jgi:hypothetical protein